MAQCFKPYRLKSGEDVPCGRCPSCRMRRVSGWAFRLLEQDKWARSAHFVTFTYDPVKVPITPNGFMTLDKSDCQKFFKRLRKSHVHDKFPIKYYLAGEYGGKTFRPHYHAIIFNADMEQIINAWSVDGQVVGHVHVDQVTGASINYTLKYMCKDSRVPLHSNDDRQPEFALMSKGLGATYLNDAAHRYHRVVTEKKTIQVGTEDFTYDIIDPEASRMYLTMPGGWKTAMPRYYKLKLFPNDFERAVIAHVSGKTSREEFEKKVGDTTYFRNIEAAIEAAFERFKVREQARNKI